MDEVEGSKQPVSFFFFVNVPRANSSEEMRVDKEQAILQIPARRKAGTKAGTEASRFESGTKQTKKEDGSEEI